MPFNLSKVTRESSKTKNPTHVPYPAARMSDETIADADAMNTSSKYHGSIEGACECDFGYAGDSEGDSGSAIDYCDSFETDKGTNESHDGNAGS